MKGSDFRYMRYYEGSWRIVSRILKGAKDVYHIAVSPEVRTEQEAKVLLNAYRDVYE